MDIDNNLKGVSGIYKLEINNTFYVGSSVDLKRRLSQHLRELKNNKHKNSHLQRSWNKYKIISHEILELCEILELNAREDFYIDYYNSFNNGFNQSYSSKSPLGYKHTEEAKAVMSLKKKGTKQSKEAIERRTKSLKGKKRTLEHRIKLSESKKGCKNPMYGKIEDAEHKLNRMKNMLSKERWNKGLNKDNNEIIRKMSEAKIGKPAHNRIPHSLTRLSDGLKVEAESLCCLSKKAKISLSTLSRLKKGECSNRIKQLYKLEW